MELGERSLNLGEQGSGKSATDQEEDFAGGGGAHSAGGAKGIDLQRTAGKRDLGE